MKKCRFIYVLAALITLGSTAAMAEVERYEGENDSGACKVRVYKNFEDRVTKVKVKGLAKNDIDGKFNAIRPWEVVLKADEVKQQYNRSLNLSRWQKKSNLGKVEHDLQLMLQFLSNGERQLKEMRVIDSWKLSRFKLKRDMICRDLMQVS